MLRGTGNCGKYPVELRAPAVQMVLAEQRKYPPQWKATVGIPERPGVGQTLQTVVRRAVPMAGNDLVTTAGRDWIRQLEQRTMKEGPIIPHFRRRHRPSPG